MTKQEWKRTAKDIVQNIDTNLHNTLDSKSITDYVICIHINRIRRFNKDNT